MSIGSLTASCISFGIYVAFMSLEILLFTDDKLENSFVNWEQAPTSKLEKSSEGTLEAELRDLEVVSIFSSMQGL